MPIIEAPSVYLAARYSRHPEMQVYAAELKLMGYPVTSRWILGDHDITAEGKSEEAIWQPRWAREDYEDLIHANICINFTEGPGEKSGRSRGGRHVELGIALAAMKRVIVVGHRENVFHHLPSIEFYPTWEECKEELGRWI